MSAKESPRRRQILEALVHELETRPGAGITTARLAAASGISEAALYRHFPSKAKMLEALLLFAEETVFGLVKRILTEEPDPLRRCENIMVILLGFSDRNPGITRILSGDALIGENERLQARADQFFNRLETQFKQVLREGEAAEKLRTLAPVPATANLLMAVIEGRMAQYTRSRFQHHPLDGWSEQWPLLATALFGTT